MTTLLYSHPDCAGHETGAYHPERPERLKAVLGALEAPEFAGLERREAPLAPKERLSLVHAADYVESVFRTIPETGSAHLDADTVVSPGSGAAALRAVGAVTAAVDAVMAGEAKNAFCAVRPPGHHAEPARAMGFCLFNNAAIAAQHARTAHGCRKAAVVDFDVHHGNGTQAAFRTDPELFYASTHQWPLYPGTGAREERGVGNIFNAPLPPGAGSGEFRAAMEEIVLPALDTFAPDFLVISAGFDAHARDPLAGLNLVEDDYRWVTERLAEIAARSCGGRLVSTLEGGYDLDALGASAAAHVGALMAA